MVESPKVALVTGAAGNVGRAVVALLAAQGVSVAALDRLAPPLPDGDVHLAIAGADLLDPAGCEAAVAQVLARYGHLDMVEYLADKHQPSISQPRKDGITSLWIAAANGHLEIVKYLAEKCPGMAQRHFAWLL